MIEGEVDVMSSPTTKPLCELPDGVLGDMCRDELGLGESKDRSSPAGFFFLGLEGAREPSMSRSALALPGKPLAMAEFDVCCEMDNGSFDLS
jgi:hypothetical protein